MNQPSSSPAENFIKKENDKLKTKMASDPIFYNTVRMMLVDYVTNNMSYQSLSEKYNFPPSLVKNIAVKFNFQAKKIEYEDKLTRTVLAKAQRKQTELIASITQAISIQVKRIIKLQMADDNYIISNNQMKDLLTSLTIFQKEYRLDNDKPTENNAIQVQVEFVNQVPIVTDNHNKPILVENESVSEEKVETPKSDEPTNEDYKDAAEVADDSISNSDLFGLLDD